MSGGGLFSLHAARHEPSAENTTLRGEVRQQRWADELGIWDVFARKAKIANGRRQKTAVELGFFKSRGVAQPGSAPALGAGGRWFESSRPDHFSSSGVTPG